MRNLTYLNRFRIMQPNTHVFDGSGNAYNGAFQIRYRSMTLLVVASNGLGWDHVSVSLPSITPSWDQMSYIKDLFFEKSEVVMQLHVPPEDHVSYHDHCLHLWRPNDGREIPRPDSILVGPK